MSEKYQIPSLEELLEAGLHFGHQRRRWHPKIATYIFGLKNRAHIFDLSKTRENLAGACVFLEGVAAKGGQVIFVGTKRQAQAIIKAEAERVGALYVYSRWLGGTLTNFDSIKKKIVRLQFLEEGFKTKKFEHYTKKERLLLEREMLKLTVTVGGIRTLRGVPDALFIIDIRHEKTALAEATRLKVPVVALVDSNSDPTLVAYPIPGNDDAGKAIELLVHTIAEAVAAGYKQGVKEQPQVKTVENKAVQKAVVKTHQLADLKFTPQTLKALDNAGIDTVEELRRYSRTDLKEIEGLGEKGLEEVLLKLK